MKKPMGSSDPGASCGVAVAVAPGWGMAASSPSMSGASHAERVSMDMPSIEGSRARLVVIAGPPSGRHDLPDRPARSCSKLRGRRRRRSEPGFTLGCGVAPGKPTGRWRRRDQPPRPRPPATVVPPVPAIVLDGGSRSSRTSAPSGPGRHGAVPPARFSLSCGAGRRRRRRLPLPETSAPDAVHQQDLPLAAPEAADPLSVLRTVFGFSSFRPGQREVIDAVLAGRDCIAVMPTGAGKSLTYQLPARMLPGTVLVVSPLISLMKDQVDAVQALGFRAVQIDSTLEPDERRARLAALRRGDYELVYLAPEALDGGLGEFVSSCPISLRSEE